MESSDFALIARPGDTLIVATVRPVTQALAAQLRGDIMAAAPGLRDVIVLTGVTQVAAYRQEPDGQPAAVSGEPGPAPPAG